MRLRPTEEQFQVTNFLLTGESMLIRALAGTGKTSTLVMLAEEYPDLRFQYIVFNKAMQVDADAKFPGNVAVDTAHRLARLGTGLPPARISRRPTNTDLVAAMECTGLDVRVGNERIDFSAGQIAEFARSTVGTFCKTTDRSLAEQHVTFRSGLLEARAKPAASARSAVAKHVLPYAKQLWNLYSDDANDGLGYSDNHDIYLKRWQLLNPRIDAQVILFDEAQDADPVMTDVVLAQEHAQVIFCGDSYQAIYEWRGAVDALDRFADEGKSSGSKVPEFWLRESFRFGGPIASEAQRILKRMGCRETIVGAATHESSVGVIDKPRCIVCRTNKGALEAVSDAVDMGMRPHIAGRNYVSRLRNLARNAQAMREGGVYDHHVLNAFKTWQEVVEWARLDDQELDPDASAILTIDEKGPKKVLFLLDRHVEFEADADIVITTVHQAKGREWDTVRLADDFKHPDDITPGKTDSREIRRRKNEELRVCYVAITRARRHLDLGGGLWRAPRREQAIEGGGS